ncbi:MAG: hypothetical protein QOC96_1465 [Acidobacteriota bacterium]|jgi:GH43 family beta-xylosidase|nr:hypothetical protein [Acidobacteriota bacterium]
MKAKSIGKQFTTGIFLLLLLAPSFRPALAQKATFTEPIVTSQDAADPWIIYKDGFYYFTFTAGDHIEIWKSPRITDIDKGLKVTVWRHPSTGPECCDIWAPELHFINNRWYIYFAADNGNDANHRLYVLESTTTDAQGSYVEKGKISAPSDRWAIDGTVLQKNDGSLYLLWSGWSGATQGPQNIYIAPMSNPWTVTAERTLISSPTNAWEKIGWSVNEGPEVLQKGGNIFIVYSASGGSTPDYCLGMLINRNGNVLDPQSWTKSPGCVFAKTNQVFGPGHNSFVKSPDQTEDWIVYHARNTPLQTWSGRTTRAQKYTWNADNTPNFGAPVPPNVMVPVPSGEPAVSPSPLPSPSPTPAPILLTEEPTERAAALDALTLMRDPFYLPTTNSFGVDRQTRIMLFAANAGVNSNEDNQQIIAQAENLQGKVYPLTVEFSGEVPAFSWLTEIVAILPSELVNSGDVWVSINVRNAASNRVLISLRQTASLLQK